MFRRIRVSEGLEHRNLDTLYNRDITPDDVEIELADFKSHNLPLVVLDEFDQISDVDTKLKITETIKAMSDHSVDAKIVLVGITNNASELIAQHASISRALKQVQMPRLVLSELETIVTTRYRRCGISVDDDALFQIAFLARGLPYYAHLIGRHAGVAAVDRQSMRVKEDDVFVGLREAMKDVDQTITEIYLQAVVSQRPDETLYEPVLVACALAD